MANKLIIQGSSNIHGGFCLLMTTEQLDKLSKLIAAKDINGAHELVSQTHLLGREAISNAVMSDQMLMWDEGNVSLCPLSTLGDIPHPG